MEHHEDNRIVEEFRKGIQKSSTSERRRAFEAFALAALGSIPWVGGFISAAASYKLEEDEIAKDSFQTQWLEEHTVKLRRLHESLEYITGRFENIGEQIDERLESEEYLDIVRKAFRVWDKADTDEKRKYVADLIANASSTTVTSDDVVRLFIEWLEKYHEVHFAVIREIYKNPGVTRYDIWEAIHGEFPREDSPEADLYKMVIRDLSTGGVIRQYRETTSSGEFLKRPRTGRRSSRSSTMTSAFDETKSYILTALGEQFIQYTMVELVPRVDEGE